MSVRSWPSATARADRVLVFTMAICVAITSLVAGTAMAPSSAIVRFVPFAKEVVRYAGNPEPAASMPRASDFEPAPAEKLLEQHRCLAQAMYYEARGEGEAGERAVAEVVLNRLRSGRYGRSICAVVFSGASRPGCQFSFACDGSLRRPRSRTDWHKAQMLSQRILAGEMALSGMTGNALNYHAAYVHPGWADRLVRTAQIGNHIFLRPSETSLRGSAE